MGTSQTRYVSVKTPPRHTWSVTDIMATLSAVKKSLTAPFVGAFQMIADPLVTEHYAKAGLQAVLIDQQHGLMDERTAFECVQRLEKFPNCFPMIRVADNCPSLISRALDAGACGIIAPMVNTREDAVRLVEQCRYAPVGKRSWGPSRASMGEVTTVEANTYIKVFAMIETREAIQNLDSILDLEGLDGAFLGPSDLSISLGVNTDLGVPRDPEVVSAIQKVLEGCKTRNKLGMIYCGSRERARQCLDQGWGGVFPGADMSWITATARDMATLVE